MGKTAMGFVSMDGVLTELGNQLDEIYSACEFICTGIERGRTSDQMIQDIYGWATRIQDSVNVAKDLIGY